MGDICTNAEEVLRDRYTLTRWLTKQQTKYFRWCDQASHELTLITGKARPPTQTVLGILVLTLRDDATFATFVRKRGDGLFLEDEENWQKLRGACAAMILEEYLTAIDEGRWP